MKLLLRCHTCCDLTKKKIYISGTSSFFGFCSMSLTLMYAFILSIQNKSGDKVLNNELSYQPVSRKKIEECCLENYQYNFLELGTV